MFRKRETESSDGSEYRAHDRHVVEGMKVYVDRQLVEILDYSDGGMRIRTNRQHRRTAVIEIFRHGQPVRKVVAVKAWEHSGETGYSFRPKLKIAEVDIPEGELNDVIDDNRNITGGVSGNALRDRLKI